MSRAVRRSLRAVGVAALACAALLGFSAPAQAQTDVLSATLTVKDLGSSQVGCANTTPSARCSDFLSEDEFTYDSTDYAVTDLFVRPSGSLVLGFNADLTTAAQTLTLDVAGTTFAFEDAETKTTAVRIWSNSGLSWSVDDPVVVKLVEPAPTVPGAPVLTATAGDGEVVLTWTAPASDGGEAITRYEYRHKATSSLPFVSSDSWTSAGTARTATVGSLTNGTPYSFEVRAVNIVGAGTAATASATLMAAATPGIRVSTTMLSVEEGAIRGNSYTVRLDTQPTGNVTVTITGQEGTNLSVISSPLTFTSTDWNQEQTVRLGASANNNPAEETVTLRHAATGGGYDSVAPVEVRVTITQAQNNPATGSPVITGTAQVGQSLYASFGSVADADGTRNIVASYQWIRVDGATETDITGATITPYTPVADDVGKQLKVRLSFTDDLGNPESRTSAATATVAAAGNTPATGNPFITGPLPPQVGQSLSASVGSINDADGTTNIVISYQWIRVDGATETDIQGATTAPYTPVADDVGKQLKVRASFTDDLGNPESRTSPATLAVQAAANNAPEFTDGANTTRSVAENTAASRNIGTAIAATDADGGDTLRYTLGGTDMASFAIVSTSGQLQTRAALDYETKSSYAVTVSVSDGNGGSDSIGVTITVTDVNEQPGRPAAPSVGATANSHTSLDVSWTAPGLNGGPAITGYHLQYRQGTGGNFTNGPQNVSGTSAMITGLTAGTSYQVQVRSLNGETPSDWSPAGTGSTSSTAQPTLTLEVGPNRFSEAAGSVQICVVPSAPSSQRITVQVATADGTATAPGDYVSHSGTVALQPQQQRACFTVTLVDDAEAEGDETFTVTLSNPVNATLGGARASVAFTIVDNDGGANVAPTFTEGTSTTRSVAENTAPLQNIGAPVAATDADSGDTLDYTLGGTDFKSFSIHLNTGQLLTQAALDFETKSSYAVSISVSDGNGGTDSISVTITVTDVNEQPGRPAAPSVGATANSDTSLDVSWTAPGLNGGPPITGYHLQYRQGTSGPWTTGPQNVSGTSAAITSLTAGTSYQVQVRAVNGETLSDWSPAGTGSTTAAANNAPEFTEGTSTTRSVAENTAPLQNIGAPVAATDADSGDTLDYTLGGTDFKSFSIHLNTGQLLTQAALDFETKSSYAVSISVSDGNGGTDSISVTITVTDVNEQPGRPAAPSVGATANSDTSLDVSWTAPGLNGGPPITGYHLQYRQGTSGPWTNGPQNVSGTSAAITSLTAGTSYQVQVRAVNGETLSDWSPAGTGSTTAAANNAPEFTEGTSTTRSVAENTAPLQNIGAPVAATDADSGDTLGYTLGGTDFKSFSIHLNTGQLLTQAALDFETKSSYAVSISVSDGNGGTDSISVTITVTDVNEQPGRPAAPSVGATANSDTSLDVSWTAPGLNGGPGITGYNLQYRQGTSGSFTNGPQNVSGTSAMITGLTAGTSYQVQVRALNGETPSDWSPAGTGSTSSTAQPTLTPPPPPPPPPPPAPVPTAPTAPRDLQAEPGDGEVTLAWEAPESDGRAAITEYEIRIDRTGEWTSIGSTDLTFIVTDLSNGQTYVFEVRAVNEVGPSPPSNAVEATPRAEEVILEFAHFGNGYSSNDVLITSDLVLVNVSEDEIRPVIYFFDRQGELFEAKSVIDINDDLEIREDGGLSLSAAVAPLGELTISTHGRGEVVTGSVRVVANGPIGGVVRFDIPGIGVAGVGASEPTGDALFPARRQAGGIRTAVAIHNLAAEMVEVRCRLMQDGVVLEEEEIELSANGQDAWFIEEEFTETDTTDFVGSVRCTAPGDGQFTGVAVELDAGDRIFTTLPVVPVGPTGAGGQEVALDFAHFGNGESITSELVLLNVGTTTIRPALYFYDQGGDLIVAGSVVDVRGGLEVREDGSLTVRSELAPLGELTISTHGEGNLVTGSVKVVSDGPIGGMLRFDLPHIGEAVVGASPPISDALFPVRRQEGGINTGAAVRNLEAEAVTMTCHLIQGGDVLATTPVELAAGGQKARFINELFPDADTSDFEGSVRCTAPEGKMFTGVALEMDVHNRIFTTLPVVPVRR